MKRNMVPLLGIAFVVAIISTGVFYGLFAGKLRSSSDIPGHAVVVAARDLDRGTVLQPSDLRVSEMQGVLGGAYSKPEEAAGATLLMAMKANEPLLQERLAPRASDGSAAGGSVPSGMRAVTVHVVQSESLIGLLHAGSRVDLQAVSEKSGGSELRTVLENVQILAVNAADANGNRPSGVAVSVLIRAQDADMVALADAGSRMRVALRNPLDEGTTPRHALALAALFSGGNNLETEDRGSARAASAAIWDHPIQLHVRVLDVSDAALEELRGQSSEITSDNSWRVAAFRSGDEAARLVQMLEQKRQLEIVSSERLMAGVGRPISYHTGVQLYRLRVQFSPEWLPNGKLGLRIQPQVSAPSGAGVAMKKYDTELPDTSSFLVQSLGNDAGDQNSASKLFPGHSWEHRHLVIFVSARTQQTSSVAVAHTDRRR